MTVAVGWLDKHPKYPEALMAMGAAYGVSSRLLCTRKEWIKAYFQGRKAIGFVRKAAALDPELYDAYVGIGMYEYYNGVYSHVDKVLAKLRFGGNRLQGIEHLKIAAARQYPRSRPSSSSWRSHRGQVRSCDPAEAGG